MPESRRVLENIFQLTRVRGKDGARSCKVLKLDVLRGVYKIYSFKAENMQQSFLIASGLKPMDL